MSHLLDESNTGVLLDEQSNSINLDPVTFVNAAPSYEADRNWYRASKTTTYGSWKSIWSFAYPTSAEALTQIAQYKTE